ncbi:hypothetical protein OAS19_00665 [Altererythrobacter sp.]|nr:hypothetical protein [Altererythrobacter sp.]
MSGYADTPAWIALFMGLYSLAAGVGELRNPGMWLRMIEDFERSPATMFLTGVVCIALGAAIYLASPWQDGDWLSVAISVLGGLIAAEGLAFIAAGDRFIATFKRVMGTRMSLWAGLSAAFGAAVLFYALSRLQFT